jgi:hypothetical protein
MAIHDHKSLLRLALLLNDGESVEVSEHIRYSMEGSDMYLEVRCDKFVDEPGLEQIHKADLDLLENIKEALEGAGAHTSDDLFALFVTQKRKVAPNTEWLATRPTHVQTLFTPQGATSSNEVTS